MIMIHIQSQLCKEQVSFEEVWVGFQPKMFLPLLVIVFDILLFSSRLIILIV